MEPLKFPLQLTFKITTLSNDFVARDVNGDTVAYVRQKMLKLVDEVQVFENENRSVLNYTIKADRWLDFNATYVFTDRFGKDIGRIARKGWASIWKANYDIMTAELLADLHVREENPWAKVFDAMLGEIPLLGMLSGYVFHPAYLVLRSDGTPIARLRKEPSFFERRFVLDKLTEFKTGEEERMFLGFMMMILLERQRG